ncbi:MAG: cupredoxin domain-containing protein [Thermoleophilaceae bacterium]
MRLRRLQLSLALALVLVPVVPATAAEWTVEVRDFEFAPLERKIEVGDTVTWRFHDGGHTATSDPGQAESWNSGDQAGGGSYSHTFTRPGRYTYVCTPHESFMTGAVQVGGGSGALVARVRTRRRGRSVRVSFRLNEPARMTYRLRGASRRTVKRRRLSAGRHAFRVKRLRRGRYRAKLTLVDDFDKKTVRRSRFRIR